MPLQNGETSFKGMAEWITRPWRTRWLIDEAKVIRWRWCWLSRSFVNLSPGTLLLSGFDKEIWASEVSSLNIFFCKRAIKNFVIVVQILVYTSVWTQRVVWVNPTSQYRSQHRDKLKFIATLFQIYADWTEMHSTWRPPSIFSPKVKDKWPQVFPWGYDWSQSTQESQQLTGTLFAATQPNM